MNSRYFICERRHIYIDAGYRWAYWQLEEPGVVTLGRQVAVQNVLKRRAYWNPADAEKSDWLMTLLPKVEAFLREYENEQIVYADEDWLCAKEELGHDLRQVREVVL
ncbi:hypothetical protein ACFL6C_09900 [Myxococcota bacterium]